ncbi:MAG: sulfurtransferase TusA family protein, partial [Clostridia bacterium]|nr:sulfurtransferase TusA family protein [Clostridia bacterium]
MAKITVDARGLSCPQPVVLTMEALKKNAEAYEILVDNQTALNNVSR